MSSCQICSKEVGGKRNICGSCSVKSRRWYIKYSLIIELGGECEACGFKANEYNSSCFDFHHIDPKDKSFSISRVNIAYEKILSEAKK